MSEDLKEQVRVVARGLSYLVAPALFCGALVVLHNLLGEYTYQEVLQDVGAISPYEIALALVLCAANYLVLTFYDVLAMQYVHHSLPRRKTMLAALVAYAFSQTLGFPAVSGGAVRYRFYSRWGVPLGDIARIVFFSGTTFWLGLLLLGGVFGLAYQTTLSDVFGFSGPVTYLVPLACILLVAGYLILSVARTRPFAVRGITVEIPSPSLALKGIVVSSTDWILAASTLFVLLPEPHDVSFVQCLAAFLLAQLVGVISHVPGGLGVFESVMVLLLMPQHEGSAIIGSLVIFRLVYYVVPFVCGAGIFAAYELHRARATQSGRLSRWARSVGEAVPLLAAPGVALLVFVSGIVLTFSGSTPGVEDRLLIVSDIIPLAVLETSHFINSLIGTCLLILASGLFARVRSAYKLTLVLLATGAAVSLLKGGDYEEASLMLLTAAVLYHSRDYFYRKVGPLSQLSPTHISLVVMVFGASVWLGLFSYKHIDYSHELWWQFTVDADAPRFLRASVGSCVVIVVVLFRSLLFSFRPTGETLPSVTEVQALLPRVRAASSTEANLVLLGDKFILEAEDESAFLMYGVSGRSWVAMGDPVGGRDAAEELIWRFHELVDVHGGYTVFYQVSPEMLPYYLDIGLSFVKLGELAIVELEKFSIAGNSGRNFRNTVNKLEKSGFEFEIVPQGRVTELLPMLEAVSSEWLSSKSTREKGFSIGFFDPEYLALAPVAVVRSESRVIAFANLWETADKGELSVDLMRHTADAPNGLMDFLFVNLMLWGKGQGYKTFNLGMAPLSGFEARPLAPLWSKLGTYVYRHGGNFYNFEGLRRYKEKFNPRWEPRYLASPGGLALPVIVANVASLISRGMKGLVAK